MKQSKWIVEDVFGFRVPVYFFDRDTLEKLLDTKQVKILRHGKLLKEYKPKSRRMRCGYCKKNHRYAPDGRTDYCRTRLGRALESMRKRCSSPKFSTYRYYGGRGIEVCVEWRRNWQSFERWALENGYQDWLTIDRIDNDGNYKPTNCRWVTLKENIKTRRKRLKS